MIRTTIAALTLAVGAAVLAPGTAAATTEPWWGWMGYSQAQEMEARLLVTGVNRQFQPDIVASAAQVCSTLRAGGSVADALDVAADAGYFAGFQRGRFVGLSADIFCPDQVHKLL